MFVRCLGGFGLSLVGDQVWFVALAWGAASQLATPTQTALVMAAGSVPRAALLLIGGVVSDRLGAMRVVLSTQLGRVVLMALCAGLAASFGTTLWTLLIIALLFGALDAVHMPAAASLLPQLLDKTQLPAGQGLLQTLERAALVLGAPVGGFLVAWGGVTSASLFNVVLLTGAFLVLRTLRLAGTTNRSRQLSPTPSSGRDGHILKDSIAGLRYAASEPVVAGVLVVVTVLNLALVGPLNIGFALLIQARGWQAVQFSWILSAFAAGAVVGAILVTTQRQHRRPVVTGLLWVIAGSLALGAIPLLSTIGGVMIAAGCIGFTSGPASALLLGLVQARTQNQYLGRVMALVNFSALGLTPLAYVGFGQLVQFTGNEAAFYASAGLLLGTAGLALTHAELRQATLTHQPPR